MAAEQLTSCCRSLLIAAAVVRGRLGARGAIDAMRLEESYQLESWGMVEAGHDLDIADAGSRVTAPSLLVQLLRDTSRPSAAAAAAMAAAAAAGTQQRAAAAHK